MPWSLPGFRETAVRENSFLPFYLNCLHYDVIRAKPDGSCNSPVETGPSVGKQARGRP